MAEIRDAEAGMGTVAPPSAQLSSYGKAIGRALRKKRGKLEFMGLEKHPTKNLLKKLEKRRAKNKRARASRISNR